jgi:hypothetical protein
MAAITIIRIDNLLKLKDLSYFIIYSVKIIDEPSTENVERTIFIESKYLLPNKKYIKISVEYNISAITLPFKKRFGKSNNAVITTRPDLIDSPNGIIKLTGGITTVIINRTAIVLKI